MIFKVRGQRLRHTLDIVVKPCKHDRDWTVSTKIVKLGTSIFLYDIFFSMSWIKGQSQMVDIVVKLCEGDKDKLVLVGTVNYNTCCLSSHPVNMTLKQQ